MCCSSRSIITQITRISDSVLFVLCIEGDTGLVPAVKVAKTTGIRRSFVNVSFVLLQLKGTLEFQLTHITRVDSSPVLDLFVKNDTSLC